MRWAVDKATQNVWLTIQRGIEVWWHSPWLSLSLNRGPDKLVVRSRSIISNPSPTNAFKPNIKTKNISRCFFKIKVGQHVGVWYRRFQFWLQYCHCVFDGTLISWECPPYFYQEDHWKKHKIALLVCLSLKPTL